MTSLFASTLASQETASLFINEKIANARNKVNLDKNYNRVQWFINSIQFCSRFRL